MAISRLIGSARFGIFFGMYEVRVEADFAAAHFLADYHGKCERLHGHNYRVLAHAWGNDLDGGGMLVDFGVLKSALKEVCAALDHSNLNDITAFANNPSAERIAEYIFVELKRRLPDAPVSAVDVYETPTSRARFRPHAE
jgi:6-pyruvoyltetrahydropterin/6-carboxytetrahydropterin synthase